jgi:hypothetical protein
MPYARRMPELAFEVVQGVRDLEVTGIAFGEQAQ